MSLSTLPARSARSVRGAGVVLVALAILITACSPSESAPPPDATPTPAVTPAAPQLYPAPVVRIAIPAINVSAPIVPMNIRNGYMDLPYSPTDVAWYDFTSKPGMGGNAVFSAHLDYINYGPAVFARLHELKAGDEVTIRLRDGTLLRYQVTSNTTVPLASLDISKVLAPTSEETLTLITCAGEFKGDDYSHRVLVIAHETGVEPNSTGQAGR